MDIVDFFKKSGEGFMNKIEVHKDGGYVKKKFHNSFLENCYTDFLTTVLGFTLGTKIKSGKNRQYTEARYLKALHEKGFPVPELIERGNGYNKIEYVEMRELSRIIRNEKIVKSEKMRHLKNAAAMTRKMHDAGFQRCDSTTANIGIKPDGSAVAFDFEHEFGGWSREKDYSSLAVSAAFELNDVGLVKEALKSVAEGYGDDLTQKIGIVPHAYMAFFFGNKTGNLHELRKAIKYGIKK